MRFLVPVLLAIVTGPVLADDKPAPPAPVYVDDDALLDKLTEKLGALAAAKKCLPPAELKKKVAADRTCTITPAKPSDRRLDPEDVYEKVLPSVFVVGSVVEEEGEFAEGRMATAWVLAADGVLVTSAHVLTDCEDGEFFGAMNHKGEVFPLTDVLAVNRAADVAVFRIAATGLTPLPVAAAAPRVGAWVGVLGHPGDRYFTFSQGHVTRYEKLKPEKGPEERWMAVTAEFAYGSSGSPVLDRTGAVVGVAALTENVDYPEAEPAPKDKEKKDPPVAKPGSLLQMVVKLTTPAAELRKAIGGG
jgi:S1-C subfamily serine protease